MFEKNIIVLIQRTFLIPKAQAWASPCLSLIAFLIQA